LISGRRFEGRVQRRLDGLQGGTRFGPGRFSYTDGFGRGGKARIHAKRCEGFVDGVWGLDIHTGGRGTLVYRVEADGGVFRSARITSLAIRNRMLRSTVQVGSDSADGPWRTIAATRATKGGPATPLKVPIDLTPAVAGSKQFFLKITVANPEGSYCLAIDALSFQGEVAAKK
jgi:hypothetical protein